MKVCLISAIHLWVNPRLVKEADFLSSKGHEVRVITCAKDVWSNERDEQLIKSKAWQATSLNMLKNTVAGRVRWFLMAVRQKIFLELSKVFRNNLRVAEESYYRGYPLALALAVRNKADIYIAHGQAALPIAARAARYHGVRFGFDCEDLNAEALADGMRDPQLRENIKRIEREYLKDAGYVLATSIPMARFLAEEYGIPAPAVIHNAFSKKELAGIPPPACRAPGEKVSLVWMSATIGQGRGLEMVIRAIKALPGCELHIFGRFVDPLFEDEVMALIGETVRKNVVFHPMPMPGEVMKTMAQFDVGIAMDDTRCRNLSLTICNKFFLYMQAGLAVAASNLPGQKSIFDEHPEIGFCIDPSDERTFTEHVRSYCENPRELLAAKQRAWERAASQYNWDRESLLFYSLVCGNIRVRP